MNSVKRKATVLVESLQLAIVDLSVQLEKEKRTITVDYVQKTNFIMEVAMKRCESLEFVAQQGDYYYHANKEKVDCLFAEAVRFTKKLHVEGFGHGAPQHI